MLKRILFLLILPLIFCSCTNNKTEISFSSWGSITETQIINDLICDYEKLHPNIKIKFIHIPQNYFQKIHLLFASSTAPDVIFINNLYLPVYAEQLEDLTGIIDKNSFYEQSIKALSYKNKLLAVPRDISNFVFYYNKDITGDLSNDWKFEDFTILIKNTTTPQHYGVSYERDIYTASPYLLTLGYKDGLTFYKNLEGKYAPTPSQIGSSTLAQMFIDGKLGLYLSGRWMMPKIKEKAKFPFGTVVFPGIVSADASGWAVSKKSKNKEAAIDFVKYMSSKESIDFITDTGIIIPARKDSSKKIKEKAFITAITKSVPHNVDKNYSKQRDELNRTFFDK